MAIMEKIKKQEMYHVWDQFVCKLLHKSIFNNDICMFLSSYMRKEFPIMLFNCFSYEICIDYGCEDTCFFIYLFTFYT